MLKIIGWAAYIVFSLLSLFTVIATAGFWPFFAWLLLLLSAPKYLLDHVGNLYARAGR